ncbi:MAG: HEAT repeat domain-containing protein [Thermodesulfobacteriota bacterium]
MKAGNGINCSTIPLTGVKLSSRSFDPDYPYGLLLVQLRPKFAEGVRGCPIRQKISSDYHEKIFEILSFAIERKVHFCVLPEYAIPIAWVNEILRIVAANAPPNSVFILPLEHLEGEHLPWLLEEAGVAPEFQISYQKELTQSSGKRVLNLCWILAKGEMGELHSHFQAKFYPAEIEEPPHLYPHRFQGGRALRIFKTDDESPRTFVIFICFDFIGQEPGSSNLLTVLQNHMMREQRQVDWLLVPQCNPRPIHSKFLQALDLFYQNQLLDDPSHKKGATAIFWINTSGGFSNPLATVGSFGGSALVGRFRSYETELTTSFPCPAKLGIYRRMVIKIEEEVAFLYADKPLSEKSRMDITGRKGFLLEFYHWSPSTKWTLINDPNNPPWNPGFFRSHFKLLESLARWHGKEQDRKVSGDLPQISDYIPLRIELEQRDFQTQEQRDFQALYPEKLLSKCLEPGWAKGRWWGTFDTDYFLRSRGKFLLVGEVGTGKTTMLHWLASKIAIDMQRLPFYLNLRDIRGIVTYDKLSRAFSNYAKPHIPRIAKGHFDQLLDQGRLVFLFDGLDQVSIEDYGTLVRQLLLLVKGNELILATRPTPARYLEDIRDLNVLRLKPFDEDDRKAYFGDSLYERAIEYCAMAPELTKVPILAYMVKRLLIAGDSPTQGKRSGLYASFINHILFTQHSSLISQANRVHRTLKALAFWSLAAVDPQFGFADYDVFDQHNEGRVNERKLLDFGLVNSLLERGQGSRPQLFFTHQSFQEFLAAQYALENKTAKALVLKEMWRYKWQEVIKFMVGLDEKGEILSTIYKGSEKDNVIHGYLFLAAKYFPEAAFYDKTMAASIEDALTSLSLTEPFQGEALQALALLGTSSSLGRIIDLMETSEILSKKALFSLEEGLRHLPDQFILDKLITIVAKFLTDEENWIRAVAIRVLSNLGKHQLIEPIIYIGKNIFDKHPLVHQEAIKALRYLGKHLSPEVILGVAQRLSEARPELRWATLHLLRAQGEDPPPKKSIRFINWNIEGHRVLIDALVNPENLYPDLIPEVAQWVAETDQLDRKFFVDDLITLGEIPYELIPRVDQWLSDLDPQEHFSLLGVLPSNKCVDGDMAVQKEYRPAIYALKPLFEEPSPLTDLPNELIPEVTNWFCDPDHGVRLVAVCALKAFPEILPPGLIPKVAKCLADDYPDVRWEALYSIWWRETHLWQDMLIELIPEVAECLNDEVPMVRQHAIQALSTFEGTFPPGLIPKVAKCLADEDEGVRREAFNILRELSRSHEEVWQLKPSKETASREKIFSKNSQPSESDNGDEPPF